MPGKAGIKFAGNGAIPSTIMTEKHQVKNEPVWYKDAPAPMFPSLESDLETDVLIIGGGMTGLLTAYQLSKEKVRTVVLESWTIGSGTSGHSTGNLYAPVDERLYEIRKHFNEDTLKKVVQSRRQSIDLIEEIIRKYSIDCDFIRTDWNLYTEEEKQNGTLEKEYQAALAAGLDASLTEENKLSFKTEKILSIRNQAQFNPYFFLKGLSKALQKEGCLIFEHSRADEVEEGETYHVVKFDRYTIRAKHVVQATHVPKGINMLQTLLGPYREYGLAFRLRHDTYPQQGIWWKSSKGHHFSFRRYAHSGDQYLIVVGAPHKVGQGHPEESISKIETYAAEHFEILEKVYQWGGQHYHAADGLPFIGEHKSRQYIATGFATDGLVYGAAAGVIISDLILKRDNEWAELYSPSRHHPLVSAPDFIKENVNVGAQYLKDLPGVHDAKDFESVKKGEGCIVEKEGKKLAACRHENGELSVVSAVCPHMQCIVNWNGAEKTWDCPCHGSRFTAQGKVIEGPAFGDLAPAKLKSGNWWKNQR